LPKVTAFESSVSFVRLRYRNSPTNAPILEWLVGDFVRPISFDLYQTITAIRLYHLMASKSLETVILEEDRSDSQGKGQLACNKNVLGTVTADAQS
jgi:hypothetical protein